MSVVINVLYLLICLALIISVLMQSGKQAGLSGSIAGGAETFFGKGKAKSLDSFFSKVTTVVAILFMILAIVINFLVK